MFDIDLGVPAGWLCLCLSIYVYLYVSLCVLDLLQYCLHCSFGNTPCFYSIFPPVAFNVSTFFNKCSTTKEPFSIERGTTNTFLICGHVTNTLKKFLNLNMCMFMPLDVRG